MEWKFSQPTLLLSIKDTYLGFLHFVLPSIHHDFTIYIAFAYLVWNPPTVPILLVQAQETESDKFDMKYMVLQGCRNREGREGHVHPPPPSTRFWQACHVYNIR